MSQPVQSPSWSRTTRLIVGLIAFAVLLLLMWRFQALVGQIVIAAMLAYILDPVMDFLVARAKFSRAAAAIVVYLVLILIGLALLTLIGFSVASQAEYLRGRIPEFISSVNTFIKAIQESQIDVGPLHFAPNTLNWDEIQRQIVALGAQAIGPGGQAFVQGALGTVDLIGWISITSLISIYIAVDLPNFGEQVARVADHSGYREDYRHITAQMGKIWSRYLRGQIILGILIALITFVMLLILGVEGSLVLGLIAGVLTFIPYVGPTLSAVIIVVVSVFQPANAFGLTPLQFALLVGVVTMVVQQVSGNLLLPAVVGEALNMSPLTVLVSLIAGAAIAGVLGVILAAPVAATLKVVFGYVWRKLLDLPPFSEEEFKPTAMSNLWKRSSQITREIIKARMSKPVNKLPDKSAENQQTREP
jgi:predicted PurR-regulated permease PerM